MPGRFAEGPRHPGLILPASAVSEQETGGGNVDAAKLCQRRVCTYNFFTSGLVKQALRP